MIYAIPSRARAETLVKKTMPLLDRLGIPELDRRVFVAVDEFDDYRLALDAAGYEETRIHEGAVGVCANRAAIVDAFPDGARYISIDDDLRDLVIRWNEKKLGPIDPDEWREIVELGFAECDRTGARLWGLYAVPNPFFMKHRIRYDLSYVAGALWGVVNRRDHGDPHVCDLEWRDDWQRCVQCYVADGALVRFDYVTWRTTGYAGAGGLQTSGDRTKEATLADCRELVRRHPDLVSLNLTKKSGWPETRLRDRRKVAAA